MIIDQLKRTLPLAENLARQAGILLVRMQATVRAIAREEKDSVTTSDYVSEKIILGGLPFMNATMGHGDIPVYSEEAGGERRRGILKWVVDPLDGTGNYKRQDHDFGVSIALLNERDAPVLGIICLPRYEVIISAIAGMPATVKTFSGTRSLAEPSERTDIGTCSVLVDWTHSPNRIPTQQIISRLTPHMRLAPLILGSCTYAAMQVVMGRVDAFIVPYPGPNLENHAAAGLIALEAGCAVTDLTGNPWTPYAQSFVVSNGHIHQQLLSVLCP